MTSPYAREVRMMLRAALALFVFTVVIGILNGTDLVDFERKTLLTHVHVGTLGWITMTVIAASFWLFALGDTQRSRLVTVLAYATPITIAAYALAFLTTISSVRPALGSLVLLVIVLAFGWVASQARSRTLSVPHVGMLAAMAMSVVGAILGVLLGYRIATGNESIPATLSSAHPAAMVVGFLVPVGMGFIEWALDSESVHRRASLAGWFQIGLPFLGGVLAIAGLMLEIVPLVTFAVPFEIIGLAILIVRMRGPLAAVRITQTTPGRFGVAALVFLVVNIGTLFYLIAKYFSKELDPPEHLLLALDHSMFIGVMTNSIIALIALFRRPVAAAIEHVVFAGLNIGVAGFLVGLFAESAPLKRTFTPILGMAILLGVVAFLPALTSGADSKEPGKPV